MFDQFGKSFRPPNPFLGACPCFLQEQRVKFKSRNVSGPEVANLRMKKAMAECKVNLERLYYLSVHTLDAKENVKYATSRVHRDLLDLWIEKKFSYGGLSFDESEPALSDEVPWFDAALSLPMLFADAQLGGTPFLVDWSVSPTLHPTPTRHIAHAVTNP